MTKSPEPLTPEGCDLRNFPFMPLDVLRLRDSDTAALDDPEAFRAAVLLWCACWHQVPAASLPNDDATLCRLAGYGRDRATWERAKAGGALRGFVLCSDDRIYHKVVAEKAVESWNSREAYRERLAKARAAKAARNDHPTPPNGSGHRLNGASITGAITDSIIEPMTALKGEGQGEREGQGQSPLKPPQTTGPVIDRAEHDLALLEAVTVEASTGKRCVGSWYLDGTFDLCLEAARINQSQFTGDQRPLIRWLRDGLEPEDIVAAIRIRAGKDGYYPPFSLAWFDQLVRSYRRRAA